MNDYYKSIIDRQHRTKSVYGIFIIVSLHLVIPFISMGIIQGVFAAIFANVNAA
jgi:hypothetical protein